MKAIEEEEEEEEEAVFSRLQIVFVQLLKIQISRPTESLHFNHKQAGAKRVDLIHVHAKM